MPHARCFYFATLFLTLSAPMAQAQYRDMSCGDLYYERNSIYKNNGFCFKTARAIQTFGNAGCSYDDVNDVPLSSRDRRKVACIKEAEVDQGCPR